MENYFYTKDMRGIDLHLEAEYLLWFAFFFMLLMSISLHSYWLYWQMIDAKRMITSSRNLSEYIEQ